MMSEDDSQVSDSEDEDVMVLHAFSMRGDTEELWEVVQQEAQTGGGCSDGLLPQTVSSASCRR